MSVHHVALRTLDIPRLTAFYRDVLGLKAVLRPDGAVGPAEWLASDTTLVMIEPRAAGEPGVVPGTMELLAFGIAAEARDATLERLGRAGVSIEGATRFSLYVRDPDGRRVGLSHYPTPAT